MIAGTWIVAPNFGCHPRCLHSMFQNNGVLVCYLRCVMEEKEKATGRLHVLEQDIRKLLQARGSVEQLQSLLKEKGVFLEEKALQSITTSRKIMLKAKKTVSPQVWFSISYPRQPNDVIVNLFWTVICSIIREGVSIVRNEDERKLFKRKLTQFHLLQKVMGLMHPRVYRKWLAQWLTPEAYRRL